MRDGGDTRALPHSEETERAVLAAVLLNPPIFEQVGGLLDPGDFYTEINRLIYEAMSELWLQGSSIDLRTIQAKLELKNSFERVGFAYLTALDLFLPDISRVMEYANVVKERSARRSLIGVAEGIAKACLGSGKEAKDILEETEKKLGTVWVGEASEWVSGAEAFQESDRIRTEQKDGSRPMLSTGIRAIDNLTGPIEAGEMLVIGGNPKMGKSSLARQVMIEAAKKGPILIATLEETVDQVMPKMACALAEVSFTDWRLDRLEQEEDERYWEARRYLESRSIRLVGLGSSKRKMSRRRSWSDLQRIFYKADRKEKIVASVIDFIQLLVEGKDTNWELENLTSGYAMLCGELRMVGIAVSQLSQENAKRKQKKGFEKATWQDHLPQINDLRGSGGISQAAHKILFPFRPSRFEPDNPEFKPFRGMEKAKLFLAANRNGPTGLVDVWWKGSTMTYWDRSA